MSRDVARLHPLDGSPIQVRRERVFLVLAGIFLGAMAMLNILGVTKFVRLGPFELAVGVLPYPLTFLCTDLISELYGRRRANAVVFTGLAVNLLVLGFISVGDALPSIDFQTPLQRIVTLDTDEARGVDGSPLLGADGRPLRVLGEDASLEPLPGAPPAQQLIDAKSGAPLLRSETLFGRLAQATRQALLASMVAYLVAQLIDVWLFHFWKRLTRGRHLWLRNNGSTLVSQLVDTICVVGITFWGSIAAGEVGVRQVFGWIAGGYSFKLMVALLDTGPFYLGVAWLTRYLEIDRDEVDPETRA